MFQCPTRCSLTNQGQSVPLGFLCMLVIILCLPTSFPHHGKLKDPRDASATFMEKTRLARVDFLGALLLLVASTFLVAALEEAGQAFTWKSAFVITLLTVSGLTWFAFVFWERVLSLKAGPTEPVFPWRLMTSRVWIGMIL